MSQVEPRRLLSTGQVPQKLNSCLIMAAPGRFAQYSSLDSASPVGYAHPLALGRRRRKPLVRIDSRLDSPVSRGVERGVGGDAGADGRCTGGSLAAESDSRLSGQPSSTAEMAGASHPTPDDGLT